MSRAIRTVAAVILLAFAVCAPVKAQDVKVPDLDPAFRADIEKLLEITGASSINVQMANMISTQIIDNMRRQQPEFSPRTADVIREVLGAEFARAFEAPDGVRGDMIRIYASHFTRADVGALLAFYNTEVGRKTIAVLPQLAQEGTAAAQKWAVANMPRVLETLQQRLVAEGLVK